MPARLVATALPRNAAAIGVVEGIWAAGDALLSLDPGLTRAELAASLERSRPHVLLDGSSETRLADAAPVRAGTALVIATSGSTGPPKGVVLSHAALQAAVRLTNSALAAGPRDRWLCCLPLSHIAGFMTLLRSRGSGTDAIVHPAFDVDAIAAAQEATFMSVVPTMLHRLLHAGVDLTGFSRVLVGGAAVDDALVERARATGARVTVTYGMTETCGGVVYDGVPLQGVDVALDCVGRISIASPTLMEGYRLDPAGSAATLRSGRFVTQDRGEWTEDRRLHVIERLDRVIVTGGKKVSPEEVEAALLMHPQVLEAIVTGEPDETWGQVVAAIVTAKDEAQPPSPEELTDFLRARISSYKIPRSFRIEIG